MPTKLRHLLFLLPALILYCNPGTAHWSDLEEFQRWVQHKRKHATAPPPADPVFRNTYLDTSCNYPPLGAVMSAGAWSFLEPLWPDPGRGSVRGAQAFRWYLCLFETLGLVLTFLLLRELHGPEPWFLAFVFYLVPSSWAGGAIWGQIDVVDHAFILAAAYSSVRLLMRDETGPAASTALVVLGTWALACTVLLKQLTIFCLPGLLGLWASGLAAVWHRHGARRAAGSALGAGALAGIFALVLDRFVFIAPLGHSGILSYVWTSGVWHTRYLSGNAPNLWTFLGRDNYSSSDAPFYEALTPREAGMTLFFLALGILGLIFFLRWLRVLFDADRLRQDRVALCLHHFCFIGLSNFVMFVFIAGTHDRYMVHGFPFLLMGFYGLPSREGDPWPGICLRTALVAGAIYGCFIYGVLDPSAFRLLFPLRSQSFVAAVCLAALGVLYYGYQRVLLVRRRSKGG